MQTSWKIIDKYQEGDIVYTDVEFIFDDLKPVTVLIPHYKPQTDEDIIIGITNRSVSERRSLLSPSLSTDLPSSDTLPQSSSAPGTINMI